MNKRFGQVPISSKLDDTIEHCMEQLKQEQKAKRKRRIITRACISIATAAAVFSGILFLGIHSPDMEAIPLLGQLASLLHNGGHKAANPYTQQSNGITITVSKMYHDYQAMYMTVTLHNPRSFSQKTDSDPQNSGKFELLSEVHYDYCDTPVTQPAYIEGHFTDDNTFTGKVRLPLQESEPSGMGRQNIPSQFDINWNVHIIYDWPLLLWNYVNAENKMSLDNFIPPYGYNGNWNFNFNVGLSKTKS